MTDRRHPFTLRKLLVLLLMASVLVASAGWAGTAASDQIQHGLEQAQTYPGKPAQERGAGNHGCIGHLGFHVFAPVGAVTVLREPRVARLVFSVPSVRVVVPVKDPYFRPPRLSLV